MESLNMFWFQTSDAVNSVWSFNFLLWSSKPTSDSWKDRSKEIEEPRSVAEKFSPPTPTSVWSTPSSARSSFNDSETDSSSNSNWSGVSVRPVSLEQGDVLDQGEIAALEPDATTLDTNAILDQSKTAAALVHDVVEPEMSEIKMVFDRFDENSDGLICAKDLAKFVQRLGFKMSIEEAQSLVQSVDRNNDRRLDFEEFYSLYKSLGGCLEDGRPTKYADGEDDDENTLFHAFKVYDRNDNGFICAKELQCVLKQMGLPEGNSLRRCEKVIQRVASNPKNGITLQEFKSMMSSKSAPSGRRKST